MDILSSSYWIEDISLGPICQPAAGNGRADIIIIGGGFSGLWTALELKKEAPDIRVVLFEKYFCGQGPSGRNGGIVYDLWEKLPLLLKYLPEDKALALANHAEKVIRETPDVLREQGVDADFVQKGALHISTSSFHDNRAKDKIALLKKFNKEEAAIALSEREVAVLARSPRFRGAVLYPGVFTMHPAKLVQGLRELALREGVEIFEGTSVEKLDSKKGLVNLRVSGGFSWQADRVLLANGCPDEKISSNQITVSSSHMVVTEPVPDVLRATGWIGGEAITDERNTVHYMRTTKDKRIAFGLGAGKIEPYGKGYQVDKGQIEVVIRDLLSFFPGLVDRKITFGWGGPIDISPTHLPFIREQEEGVWQIGGYTGAGAGMSIIFTPILARVMLESSDPLARLLPPETPLLPPDPIKTWAGRLVRRAMLNKEEAEEREQQPSWLSRAIVGFPEKIGIHLGR